ncbi:glycosyl transferase family 1 [Chania multitudinisentens RB-25]|uniref:Glycosyl transferase family 1 n=2 Tax=Chania TaxID=1745211 RepID=W0L4B4_9GAMM|nr:glycosyl transferase family 1 [Chania multitudinisentens RB-25]
MVSDVYLPRINGVSTSIRTFRNTLATQGIKVTLVAPQYADEAEESGVIRVPGRPVPFDPEDRLANWAAMRDTVARLAPSVDLIHLQTPFFAHYAGLKASKAFGLPVVATYHTLFEEYLGGYIPWMPNSWLRALARRISCRQCNALDAVIVPSLAMSERLSRYGVVTPMHIVPTGVQVERFAKGDREHFRKRHGIEMTRPMLLFVGRVAQEKNIGFLLQALQYALRSLPQLLLVVAGDGPALPALRAQAEMLGLTNAVQFIGYLDGEHELPDCYAAADVFVFSSLTETQGLVLLEAMAAGLPVVALSSMGTTDILAAGLGSISPEADPQVFAKALLDLFADPIWHRQLRIEALAYAAEWPDTANSEKLARLYQNLLDRPR